MKTQTPLSCARSDNLAIHQKAAEDSRTPRRWRAIRSAACLSVAAVLILSRASAVDVLTQHNDQFRTGANTSEKQLTTLNVNVTQFGKLYRYSVNGYVYAQPLYVSGLSISGGTHNVLYVATMENSVYAFDADVNTTYWTVSFNNPGAGITPVPIVDITGNNNLNIHGDVGVLSTPVIDRTGGTIYVLARTKEPGPTYRQKLHALDIATGAEKFGGPVTISTSGFDSKKQAQRPALGLFNGNVYIAWGSHEDIGPYHGWLMAYDAGTLAQVAVFNSTPGGNAGAFWQAGQGPTFDSSGNLYLITGNGDFDGSSKFGMSFLKLSPTLTLLDWFTPHDYATLNSNDDDFGAAGALLLPSGSGYPGTQYVIGGGKSGKLYVLDKNNGMGHLTSTDSGAHQIWQAIQTASCTHHIHGSPVYWNSAQQGQMIYIWGENDVGKAFKFNGSTFTTTPFTTTSAKSPTTGCGMPGSMLSLSANGGANGILWANCVYTGDAVHNIVPGILRALDANNLGNEIWNSRMNLSRDDIGNFAKYVCPTVVNGKVYMASFSSNVTVYGLLNLNPDFSLSASPSSQSVTPGGSTSYTVTVTPQNGFNSTVTFSVTGLPSGASASFNPTSVTGSGNSTMTVSTSGSTPTGTSTLTITGTGGGLSHTATVTLAVNQASQGAQAISINFSGAGTQMGSSETAGVVAKTHWNNAQGLVGTSQTLNDEFGNVTTATLTWSDPKSVFNTGIADTAGNNRMMKYYLDASDTTTTTVSVAGLPSSANGWTVYAYFDGNNGETREGAYTISGSGITTTTINGLDNASTDFSGTFNQANNSAGNYVKFTIGNVAGLSLSVTAVANGATAPRAPLNGLQIIPVTAPPSANPISINLGATNSTVMGSSESAGVVASTHWNNALGLSGSNVTLNDSTGAATSARLAWNDPKSATSTGIADNAGNNRMMKFYLDSNTNQTTTVTVSSLPSNANGYKVYVYFDGNNAETREGAYTISGTGITTTTINGFDSAATDFSGTFVQANNSAGNYVVFTIGNVSGFTVSATAVDNGAQFPRGPLNGLQIVPQ